MCIIRDMHESSTGKGNRRQKVQLVYRRKQRVFVYITNKYMHIFIYSIDSVLYAQVTACFICLDTRKNRKALNLCSEYKTTNKFAQVYKVIKFMATHISFMCGCGSVRFGTNPLVIGRNKISIH